MGCPYELIGLSREEVFLKSYMEEESNFHVPFLHKVPSSVLPQAGHRIT